MCENIFTKMLREVNVEKGLSRSAVAIVAMLELFNALRSLESYVKYGGICKNQS